MNYFSEIDVLYFSFVFNKSIFLVLKHTVMANEECFLQQLFNKTAQQLLVCGCGFTMGSIRNASRLNLACNSAVIKFFC